MSAYARLWLQGRKSLQFTVPAAGLTLFRIGLRMATYVRLFTHMHAYGRIWLHTDAYGYKAVSHRSLLCLQQG